MLPPQQRQILIEGIWESSVRRILWENMPFLKNWFLKKIYFVNKYPIFPQGKIKLTGLQVPHLEGFCQPHSWQAERKFDRRWLGRVSELSASSTLPSLMVAGVRTQKPWVLLLPPRLLSVHHHCKQEKTVRKARVREEKLSVIPLQFRWDGDFYFMFFWKCLLCIFIFFFNRYFWLSFCFSLNSGEMLFHYIMYNYS